MRKLSDCNKNQSVIISNISEISKQGGSAALKRHLQRLGLTKGTAVFIRKTAPFDGPIEINVRGCELALRKKDAGIIEVEG